MALFHLLPLVLDAAAIQTLFVAGRRRYPARLHPDPLGGSSANSLMPAGQIGGPVLMVRHLAQRGVDMPSAAAAITVATTYQMLAQMLFALTGLTVLAMRASHWSRGALGAAM